MTPEQFCYWLQGFSELTTEAPSKDQWILIQEHLKLVFNKVTPQLGLKGSPPYISPSLFNSNKPQVVC